MSASTELIVWGIVALLFLGAEMITFAFVGIYFAIGAAVAAVLTFFTDNIAVQVIAFAAVALGLLFLTRKLVMRKLPPPPTASNAHTVVGKRGVVTIEIDNDASTGQVRIGTEYWTARLAAAADARPERIGVNEKVEIVDVQGVTAQVVRLSDLASASGTAGATPNEPQG